MLNRPYFFRLCKYTIQNHNGEQEGRKTDIVGES
jgi:hypothetical protein